MMQVRIDHTKPEGEPYMEKRGRGLFHITEKLVDHLEFGKSIKG